MAQEILPFLLNEYAVKLLCGTIQPGKDGLILAPGNYYTAINIHNPSAQEVDFYYKIAIAGVGEGGPIFGFFHHVLKPDQALEIDCPEIEKILGSKNFKGFAKGFVVIHTRVELDVVAVYTIGAPNATALEIERVQPRKLALHWPPTNVG